MFGMADMMSGTMKRHLDTQARIVTELVEAHYAGEHRIAESHPECVRCVRVTEQLAAATRLADAIYPS